MVERPHVSFSVHRFACPLMGMGSHALRWLHEPLRRPSPYVHPAAAPRLPYPPPTSPIRRHAANRPAAKVPHVPIMPPPQEFPPQHHGPHNCHCGLSPTTSTALPTTAPRAIAVPHATGSRPCTPMAGHTPSATALPPRPPHSPLRHC